MWDDRGPRGLQRAFCDVCDGTFTIAKGQCTGCIRREENRNQGVVYVIFGVPLGLIGALGLIMFGVGMLGIVSIIVGFMGLGLVACGLKAMVYGQSAE